MTIPGFWALNPMNSWTGQFLREWLPSMSLASALRWRDYQIREQHGRLRENQTLPLTLRAPIQATVHLRELGSDRYTFQEVLVRQVYGGLKAHVPECSTIIDLGANIGLTSLYLAALYPVCRILSVEPDARNLRLLQTNLRSLIAAGRVTPLQAAAWGHDMPLTLSTPITLEDYDAVTVHECADSDSATVPGLGMSSLFVHAGFDRADILKIDIEGAETALFASDTDWLDRVGAIAIEFHGASRRDTGFDALAARYGFSVIEADSHTVLAIRRRHP